MRQWGYAQAMLYLAAIGVIMALGLVVYHAVDSSGYKRGRSEAETKYAQRDNEALRVADERIKELEGQARAEERRKAEELAAVSAHYQGVLKNAQAQRDRDIAAAHAGAVRLRDPYAVGATSCPGSGAREAAAGATGRDGAAAGELSREAVGHLLALADEADEVVMQLSACQAVVQADRK